MRGFGAARHAQPGHLRQSPRDEGGLGVGPVAEAVADAGGDGDGVLESAAQLHAHDVVIGVYAETGRVVELLHPFGDAGVPGGDDGGGGLVLDDLLREVGAGEDADAVLGDLREFGVDDLRHGEAGAELKSLDGAEEHRVFAETASEGGKVTPQALRGSGEHHEVRAIQCGAGVGGRGEGVGERGAGQQAAVLAVAVEGLGFLSAAGQEGYGDVTAGQQDAKGCAPTGCPDHRHLRHG